jgi:hypothetical protein
VADTLRLKKNDLQPYYYAQLKDAADNPVDLTAAAIVCTMRAADGTLKIDRQSAGISITDAANGKFEYRWQSGDTDTAGKYFIEFEITPQSGGKFTVPADSAAVVLITDSLDAQ